MFDLKLTGSEELIKLLQDTRGKKANAAIRKGSRAGCKIIAARAKKIVPVANRRNRQGEVQRGLMRKSVKVRATKKNRDGWVGCAVSIGPSDYQGVDFYAFMVEHGTKKMKARNYLKQAADETEGRASDIAQAIIIRELTK